MDAAQRYWQALGEKDAEAMAACYADDARFRDPIFHLTGQDIGKMWMGLFGGADDLEIETGALRQVEGAWRGQWVASYTFTKTGRQVHNVITTTMRVRKGKIVEQIDSFPFWKWSRMALGLPGLVLGWSPMMRRKVRKMAARRLQ